MADSKKQRAAFSQDLQSLRDFLPRVLSVLENQSGKGGWYGSVYVERKNVRTALVNFKQANVSEQYTMGAVLRIYDGYTLFEQATDELGQEKLMDAARKLAARAADTRHSADEVRKPYRPPGWAERLGARGAHPVAQGPFEQELLGQIPNDVRAGTQVHFGIAYERDPRTVPIESTIERLKALVSRCRALAPEAGLAPGDLTYAMARQSFAEEEAIFIDREVNLSQTVYRLAVTLATLSGGDRTVEKIGGLGGLETVDFVGDREIRDLLKDLKSLKSAERLEPGRFKVLFGPVLTGVLAHEAFGHSQEGDTCARGRSKAWELHKSGERVGNEHATIVNNPAVYQNGDHPGAAWGSYFFDEEGWLAREHILLDHGKLQPPMTNLTSAIRLGVPRTANGKRESWSNGVYVRQTNTYFTPGDKTLSELMAMIDDGFLATQPAGGMEDPKGMGIQVGIMYLKEVKNGQLTGRVFRGPAGGDIQMTGYVPEVLGSIIAKSKIEYGSSAPDVAKHPFNDAGGCGKYHKEIVNAGCGGPYVLLDQVILG